LTKIKKKDKFYYRGREKLCQQPKKQRKRQQRRKQQKQKQKRQQRSRVKMLSVCEWYCLHRPICFFNLKKLPAIFISYRTKESAIVFSLSFKKDFK